jgi:hypothetical protein
MTPIVGKAYRARNGTRAVVKSETGPVAYPFLVDWSDGHHDTVTADGRVRRDMETEYDLVALWDAADECAEAFAVLARHGWRGEEAEEFLQKVKGKQ